ncbi:MAG TPA: secondary thiamine-phosphate synthase enzyme YjbQ [Coriobacteriia bacterium]
MKRIELRTDRREHAVEITDRIAATVTSSGVREGVVHVHCPHTTAGVTVNEHADPDVMDDLFGWLAASAPEGGTWRHVEGNADAHVKAALVGSGATLPVSDGRLQLGTWQGVFLCEFDGPRTRQLLVTVMGA